MNKLRNRWRVTTLSRSTKVISREGQKKIVFVVAIQIMLSLLDLVGVALIGVLGALAVSGVESGKPGGRVSKAIGLLHLDHNSFQTQVALIGVVSALILITRTVLSVLFSRKTLFFLSRRAALISTDLIHKLLTQQILFVQQFTSQQTLYSLTEGVNAIMVGVIGSAIAIISDGALLLILSFGLLVVDPTIAFSTFLVFGTIGFILYKLMNVRAQELGMKNSKISISSSEKIVEVLSSYREAFVRNRRSYYASEIGSLRLKLADSYAELSFMPNISKYVIETSVVLGAVLIAAFQFILQDAVHAVATLAIFMAAGSRIAPALLRVQQGAVNIKGALGTANPTLDLIESLGKIGETNEDSNPLTFEHKDFDPSINVESVSFRYPNNSINALQNVSVSIAAGSLVALVGPSGAGKTTLADLLLGVLIPDSGKVLINQISPSEAISKWPGAIAYVPQDITIANGTIGENVFLGYPIFPEQEFLAWNALKTAQLSTYVESMPLKLNEQVGDRGTKLSGGQRQRLGIARALLTNPKLLVMDEATSALDAETEAALTESLQNLKGSSTLIIIAHRLSTVRNADLVVYIDEGTIRAMGSFQQVRDLIPDFDNQAQLMGL
jgi:ABC-type multidrug transport system fused ATPase/permease subunit